MLSRLSFIIAKPRNDLNAQQQGVLDNTLWFINTTRRCTEATRTCSCLPQQRCILKACLGCLVMSNSFQPHGLQPARLLCPWEKSSKNTGVNRHFLLQIFPTHRSNLRLLRLLHWQAGSLPCTTWKAPKHAMKRRQVRHDTYHKYKCMLYIMGPSIYF